MKIRQLGLAAVSGALLFAASGCMYHNEVSIDPAFSDSFDISSISNPGRGLGEERDPLAPVLKDVYSKSIPDDVYSDGR
ncbi:hypothetical protein [Paenibacillus sp. URB8-2]|uniref:hypothetical protein n=1 Tax=Paenibacillus sp. URB8-2 TaxID=2741301 RepID=UPI0015BC841C|nr:hypothetical protein [Paenibacillus sp. URB8-2]BCG58915.1 hypothetical protein PUR_23400 [Paenibacillus sp. URB8-2]